MIIIIIVLTRNQMCGTSSVAYFWTGLPSWVFVSSVLSWTPFHCLWRLDWSLPGSERVSHRSTSTVWACPSPVLAYQTPTCPPSHSPHPPTCPLPQHGALTVLSCSIYFWAKISSGILLRFLMWIVFALQPGSLKQDGGTMRPDWMLVVLVLMVLM